MYNMSNMSDSYTVQKIPTDAKYTTHENSTYLLISQITVLVVVSIY